MSSCRSSVTGSSIAGEVKRLLFCRGKVFDLVSLPGRVKSRAQRGGCEGLKWSSVPWFDVAVLEWWLELEVSVVCSVVALLEWWLELKLAVVCSIVAPKPAPEAIAWRVSVWLMFLY